MIFTFVYFFVYVYFNKHCLLYGKDYANCKGFKDGNKMTLYLGRW